MIEVLGGRGRGCVGGWCESVPYHEVFTFTDILQCKDPIVYARMDSDMAPSAMSQRPA